MPFIDAGTGQSTIGGSGATACLGAAVAAPAAQGRPATTAFSAGHLEPAMHRCRSMDLRSRGAAPARALAGRRGSLLRPRQGGRTDDERRHRAERSGDRLGKDMRHRARAVPRGPCGDGLAGPSPGRSGGGRSRRAFQALDGRPHGTTRPPDEGDLQRPVRVPDAASPAAAYFKRPKQRSDNNDPAAASRPPVLDVVGHEPGCQPGPTGNLVHVIAPWLRWR